MATIPRNDPSIMVRQMSGFRAASDRWAAAAAKRYLALLEQLSEIAAKGECMPTPEEMKELAPVAPDKAIRWLCKHGHIEILHSSNLGRQIRITATGALTADKETLRARQKERRKAWKRPPIIKAVQSACLSPAERRLPTAIRNDLGKLRRLGIRYDQ